VFLIVVMDSMLIANKIVVNPVIQHVLAVQALVLMTVTHVIKQDQHHISKKGLVLMDVEQPIINQTHMYVQVVTQAVPVVQVVKAMTAHHVQEVI